MLIGFTPPWAIGVAVSLAIIETLVCSPLAIGECVRLSSHMPVRAGLLVLVNVLAALFALIGGLVAFLYLFGA